MTPRIMLAVAIASLLALWWKPTERDYIRAAESAYRRGDYEEALRQYQAAARFTRDPGFLAFNQAAVLARLRRWQEAISCYTQALEDAQGDRRVYSLYGRGTARLLLALESNNPDRLDILIAAVSDLRACLRERPDFEDAHSHLSLAMQLLAHLQKEPRPVKVPDHSQKAKMPDTQPASSRKLEDFAPRPKLVKPSADKIAGKPSETSQWLRPGRGQLPAIPKTGDLPPISFEDAQSGVELEWRRITQARARASVSLPQGTSVRDW